MKTTKLLICAVAIAAAFAAAKAKGQNLPATLIGIDPGIAVTGTVDNGSFIQAYPSGVSKFTEFDAFCIEPTQGLSYGETLVYQVQNPLSLTNTDTIARLVGGYLASSQTAEDAAAVQWAIWEVTTESLSSYSLSDGNVRITSPLNQDTITLANQYLAQAPNYTAANVTFLTNADRQDVVTWNAIPEPASAGLFTLSALFLFRRRRN
ncbi:MAG: PEP-CTERM sorting domain-containing protein [Luteolibacter sp.]|uniref:PEP-CTERM sorting domain-containing protein n=1 Tax=Luteolibacter sp. TaxID=1962973 RepID=UPI0032679A62